MRKVDPVEVIAIAIPLLAEAAAVALAIGVATIWVALLTGVA